MSERRACQVIGGQRMTVRYRSRRRDDPGLRERLLALVRERRRLSSAADLPATGGLRG
jgi:putative transposase